MKAICTRIKKGASPIAYLPFERPNSATLYTFLAGILAAVAAQLFITPPLTMALRVCTATLLWSGLLFSISSGTMVWISFEIETFKEDFIRQGSPRDPETRRRILKSAVSKDMAHPHKGFNRLWRMWVATGISIVAAVYAWILLYTN